MARLDSDLEDLYRRRHGAFQVMLASVTGNVESARDVVQEAFAQALRDQKGFRGEASLEGWVWRIAVLQDTDSPSDRRTAWPSRSTARTRRRSGSIRTSLTARAARCEAAE